MLNQESIWDRLFPALLAWPILFMWFPVYGFVSPHAAKAVYMIVVCFLFIVALAARRIPFSRLALRDPALLGLFIYFLAITNSLRGSLSIFNAWFGFEGRFDGYLIQLMYIIIFFIGRSARGVTERLFKGILISISLVTIIAMFQRFNIRPYSTFVFGAGYFGGSAGTVGGTVGNINTLAALMAIATLIAIHLLVVRKEWWVIVPLLLFAVEEYFIKSSIYMLTVGTALIVYIIVLYVHLPAKRKLIRRIVLIGLVILAIVLGILVQTNSPLGKEIRQTASEAGQLVECIITGQPIPNSLGSDRIAHWRVVIQLIKMRPVRGFGVENLTNASWLYTQDLIKELTGRDLLVDRSHNELLDITVWAGLPALYGYLWVIIWILIRGFKQIKENNNYVLVCIVVVAYLAQAMISIKVPSVSWILWLGLGLLSAQGTLTAENQIGVVPSPLHE